MSNPISKLFHSCVRGVGQLYRETFRSFGSRNFAVYSTGMFVSNVGTWMQSVALSWLVYRLTGAPSALGLVVFANNLPLLLFTFLGGLVADRFDKRKILFVTQSLAMIQAILLAVLVYTNHINMESIVALAAFLGTVTAFDLPTRQTLVPSLIEDSRYIPNAIGLSSAIFHVSRMLAPALAGALIAGYGEVVCFALNAISFVAAFLCLWHLRLADNREERLANRSRSGASELASLKEVLKKPAVFTLLFLAVFVSTFGMQYSVLLPVIADKLLGGQSLHYGFLSASGGVGALFGALLLASSGSKSGLRRRLGVAMIVLAMSLAVLATSRIMVVSVVAMAVAGICMAMHWGGGNSLIQMCADPSSRGKLMGVYSTFTLGLAPFTGLLAGWSAETLGLVNALYLSAGMLALGAFIYLFLSRHLEDHC
jgi:MFS family permease